MHPSLSNFLVVVDVSIRWGEMDVFGHVNNTAYFRYFEIARVAFFDAIGFREGARIGPILAGTSCRFRRPLTYPDQVSVGAMATRIEDDRFAHEYVLVSEKLDAVAAVGDGIVVSYDYDQRVKAPLPRDVRRRLEDFLPSER